MHRVSPWSSMGVLMGLILSIPLLGCPKHIGDSMVYKGQGIRMQLEVLPRRGVNPLDVIVMAHLEMTPEVYHRYHGCFQLTFDFADDERSSLELHCDEYRSDRSPGTSGFFAMAYSVEHTYTRSGTFDILAEVRPHGHRTGPSLVHGKVFVTVYLKRRYGDGFPGQASR